jgi:hypothetical protein
MPILVVLGNPTSNNPPLWQLTIEPPKVQTSWEHFIFALFPNFDLIGKKNAMPNIQLSATDAIFFIEISRAFWPFDSQSK